MRLRCNLHYVILYNSRSIDLLVDVIESTHPIQIPNMSSIIPEILKWSS